MASRNKKISEELLCALADNNVESVHIEDDGFFSELAAGNKKQFGKRAARLIGILLVTIFMVYMIIYGSVFYLQEILLYPSRMSINQYGTFTMKKSSNSEYAMFLFDAGVAWQPSGIQVNDGDVLYVSASGGYHTNCRHLVNAVSENRWADIKEEALTHTHGHVQRYAINKDSVSRYVFMSRAVEEVKAYDTLNRKVIHPHGLDLKHYYAWFGDALFQVCPEQNLRDTAYTKPERIYAIPRPQNSKKHKIKVENNGTLSFCVNDNNPSNNIGQVLVVMEIYRKETCKQVWRNILTGKLLEAPYFYYDMYKHQDMLFIGGLLFFLIVLTEMVLFSVLLYCIPFLFLCSTWKKFIIFISRQRKSLSSRISIL